MDRARTSGFFVILVTIFLISLFPMASLVGAAGDGITLSAPYGPPGTANTWERFTIPLTAETFDVDGATFDGVMSHVTQFRIRTELHTGNDIGGLDNVSVGTRHSSDFNRSLEGWSAAGDGTMEWIPSGGVSGGYLQISDWASGDWHWAVAPADWSGNWAGLIGSSIVFEMKTDQPSYAAVVEILSSESEWLTLSADPMMVPPGGTSSVTVSANPAASQALSVSLASSDTSCITVPSSMTIGSGQSSGQFTAQAAPGAEIGCKAVITASAPGYGTSRITLSVGQSPVIDGDADGDGVPDISDQCPNTPAGTSVGSNGCPGSGGAANLVVESRTVASGDTVAVPVKLQNVTDVGSLNFNITYDASVVSVSRVDKGALLSGISFVVNPNESGIIRFGFAAENAISGTGSIGHIVFEAIGSVGSSSPLSVSGVEATDSSGSTLALQTRNGLVTVNNKRMPGDYNGDGLITELDALAALRMSTKLLAEDLILDMDQNGKVTAEDARQILSIAVRGS